MDQYKPSHVLKFSDADAGPQAWQELEIISPPPYQSSAAKFQIDFRGAVCRVLWPLRCHAGHGAGYGWSSVE